MPITQAASIPATLAIYNPATPITTDTLVREIFKNIATILAAPATVLITPDDMTEAGVTVTRGIMDRENKNGGSDAPASISRLGTAAKFGFELSRDVPALDTLFFRPDTIPATATDPGFDGFSDKAGLTTGLCEAAPLYVCVLLPHLCGTATTDVSNMLALPFAVPRSTDVSSKFAINDQYSVTGLSFEGLAAPAGAIKGKYRLVRGIKPTA